jgi:hypothetical protein
LVKPPHALHALRHIEVLEKPLINKPGIIDIAAAIIAKLLPISSGSVRRVLNMYAVFLRLAEFVD